MAGALLGGWLLVYLIVWRGLHQSGYIIWFTALFPYTVMSVLLVRAVTLPGASDGLWAYIDVRSDKLNFVDIFLVVSLFYLSICFSLCLFSKKKSDRVSLFHPKLENDLWHFLEFQIDWSYMKKGSTWIDAATQIFFAYSVGVGALPALGSYNRFNHNCFRFASAPCEHRLQHLL